MSLVKVSGNASGTGTLTIAAPNTNSNYTLTLPAATGNFLTSATTTGFPAGSVIQVVNATYVTETQIATTTLTDTGLTASITPTSTSSKILVLVNLMTALDRETNSALGCKARLLRGATQILDMGATNGLGIRIAAGTDTNGRIAVAATMSLSYLDSPSTTSSTTYKMQAAPTTTSNGGTVIINWLGDVNSTITLMEIAA